MLHAFIDQNLINNEKNLNDQKLIKTPGKPN